MQAIISAIDKATKAGVYDLNEVLVVAKQIEQLGQIIQEHKDLKESAIPTATNSSKK
tara:strand:+ start:11935 stop:12105 length:171 start_codon:yes stop_codon:yes gene_type:complete